MEELVAMCRREHPRLVGMLGLYCGDADVAEDLAQEALIRLCRHWGRIKRSDSPERWLHRVAINLAHSHYRRRAIENRVTSVIASRVEPPRTTGAEIETLDLLKKLPSRQRAALLLHYYLDMTIPDVAQVMEVPEGTAKTLVHRATRALANEAEIAEAAT